MRYSLVNDLLKISITEDIEKVTIREYFISLSITKKKIYMLFLNKQIQLNGSYARENDVIKKDDEIQIRLDTEEIDFACDKKEALVIYEDDLVCIVHKDAGIIVHEDDKNKVGTLSNQVATYYRNHGIKRPVRYIHRLDEDTQGLVLFCKVPLLQPWFDEQLAAKQIVRVYQAIVSGQVKDKKQTINKAIGRDRHHSNKMRVSKTGKDAVTHVKVLKSNQQYSLVECVLENGRTHQIRVHLASIGHPIVNDKLYGRYAKEFNGMGLYAISLSWMDPLTKEKRVVIDSSIHINFK